MVQLSFDDIIVGIAITFVVGLILHNFLGKLAERQQARQADARKKADAKKKAAEAPLRSAMAGKTSSILVAAIAAAEGSSLVDAALIAEAKAMHLVQDPETTLVLLEGGADSTIKDKRGKTAMDRGTSKEGIDVQMVIQGAPAPPPRCRDPLQP